MQDKEKKEVLDEMENSKENEEVIEDETIDECLEQVDECEPEKKDASLEESLIEKLKIELTEKENKCEEYLDMLKRTMADFDNFRKRTQKEKEGLYDDGFADAIKGILPVLDNLERAVSYEAEECKGIIEGVEMVLKIFKDILAGFEVLEIPALNEKFNPDYHNAVAHVEDENLEENIIVDVFQKGYKYKDKILRYSMVKVAN